MTRSRTTLAVLVALPALAVTTLGATSTATAAVDNHLTLVSVAHPETLPGQANGSFPRAVSDDGRFVLFASSQPKIVVGDEADGIGRYLYLRDLAGDTTIRISHGDIGSLNSNAAISADGSSVAYAATDHDGEQATLRLYSRATGRTAVIATSSTPGDESVDWYTVGMSDSGRYVDYTRTVAAPGGETFETRMYRYDRQAGSTSPLIAGKLGGAVSNPTNATIPAVSGNGRYVAFVQALTPADTNTAYRLIRLDTTTGAKLVIGRSLSGLGVPQNAFGDPTISNSGRFVGYSTTDAAFQVTARLYDANDGQSEVVSRDNATGAPSTGSGTQVSGDGRWVAFVSAAADIVPGATGVPTVYRYDTHLGTIDTVVRNRQGVAPGGGYADLPYIDGDGSTVVFDTVMQNLSAGATNRLERVYAWQL
jgi:hypothetical protein